MRCIYPWTFIFSKRIEQLSPLLLLAQSTPLTRVLANRAWVKLFGDNALRDRRPHLRLWKVHQNRQKACQNIDFSPPTSNFWYRISGLGPKNLHFWQVPSCCCCSRDLVCKRQVDTEQFIPPMVTEALKTHSLTAAPDTPGRAWHWPGFLKGRVLWTLSSREAGLPEDW